MGNGHYEDESNVSDPVTWKEAQNMPYLQAVIQETLRIHSAAGYILERTVAEGGVELAGRWFPEGVSRSRSRRKTGE